MDNLTHSLFGLTLARTPLGRAGRGATATLLLASNAPDIDIVTTAGGAVNYLEWHRGPTHGPLGIVGLGLVTAGLVWGAHRLRTGGSAAHVTADAARTAERSGPAPFLLLWAVAVIGVLCHVLMDLPTSYGTRPLSPFSWQWYAEDWLPIIDIYLLTILGAGLWFGSRGGPGTAARNAAIAIALMAVNYGVRAVSHHQAIARAPAIFGPLLPEPCADSPPPHGLIDSWPRSGDEVRRGATAGTPGGERSHAAAACRVEVAAMPSFFSPFEWRVVARLSNGYEVRDVDLLERPGRGERAEMSWRRSVRYPNQWTPAVSRAAESPIARVFLGFSRFPSVSSVVDGNGNATVRWRDIRFVQEALAERARQRADLFTATVRLDRAGRVIEEKLGP